MKRKDLYFLKELITAFLITSLLSLYIISFKNNNNSIISAISIMIVAYLIGDSLGERGILKYQKEFDKQMEKEND